MTTGEIQQTVEDFALAAERAEKAGIDGIEVHGGHGFLVGQFLDASNNLRSDGYGSDAAGRARFVHEVVAYVGKAGIADHAFAHRVMADPAYVAPAFPVTRDHLRAERLGEPFIDYFATNWPHLVSE